MASDRSISRSVSQRRHRDRSGRRSRSRSRSPYSSEEDARNGRRSNRRRPHERDDYDRRDSSRHRQRQRRSRTRSYSRSRSRRRDDSPSSDDYARHRQSRRHHRRRRRDDSPRSESSRSDYDDRHHSRRRRRRSRREDSPSPSGSPSTGRRSRRPRRYSSSSISDTDRRARDHRPHPHSRTLDDYRPQVRPSASKPVAKHRPPHDAVTPAESDGWAIVVFRPSTCEDALGTVSLWGGGGKSWWLLGRGEVVGEEAVVDVDLVLDHPTCSKQHAVVQFRGPPSRPEHSNGAGELVQPYLIDLESTNGTSLNGEMVPVGRYVELRDGDVLKFGESAREYVVVRDA